MSTRPMRHTIATYLCVGSCLFSLCVVSIGCSKSSKNIPLTQKTPNTLDMSSPEKIYREKIINTPKTKKNIVEKILREQSEVSTLYEKENNKKNLKKRKTKTAKNLEESRKSNIIKKKNKSDNKKLAKLIVPKDDSEYIKQEKRLESILREIEESGYVLDQEKSPKILKRDPLKPYEGFRITFQAKEGKYLPSLEEMVEKNLEERFAKNFRRIYRGKMSKIQEGIYIVDFIPQEYLSTYKQNELSSR